MAPHELLCEPLDDVAQSSLSRREVWKRGAALGLSRPAIAALVAAVGTQVAPVAAQDGAFAGETLRVQFWSDPEGDIIQRHVVDPFQKETGAEVIVEHGFTSDSIDKLQAQRDDPQLDVVLMDDIGVLTAASEGLLQPLDLARIPNAADVDPRFIVAGGLGIGFFTYVTTLLFNTDVSASPPDSWRDLWSEDLRDRVAVPTSNQIPALHLIIAASLLAGGDQYDPEPGFALLEELRSNVQALAGAPAEIADLVRDGDIEMLSWTSYVFKDSMDEGYPIDNTFDLEEGVFAAAGCACIPEEHPGSQEVAEAFIDRCLSVEAQEHMARDMWFGPTNSLAGIPPEIAQRVITFDQLDNTIEVDLEHLLSVRADWALRYEQVLAG